MSEVPPTTPPASRKRAWTILGRLSQAVREQNWFAVVLEVCIVVLGVVIGFQVTAWGQGRADRAKEQTYLRQLAADLHETEDHIGVVDAWLAPVEAATGAFQRSFYEPTRPPPDTLGAWIIWSSGNYKVNAITGTADALVSTGDLALIRNDSLRSAITAYLRVVEYEDGLQAIAYAGNETTSSSLMTGRDLSRDWELFLDGTGFLSETDPLYPLPRGPRREPPRFDVEALYSSPTAEAVVFGRVMMHASIRLSRERLLDATVALREQVETELNR